MFENEAEEYIKVNNLEWELECNRASPIGEVSQAYQKGAEFGYNKAKEEMQELLKEGVQLLKNSDELYGYQIRDFYLKCKPFIKEDQMKRNLYYWVKNGEIYKVEMTKGGRQNERLKQT